ncbi:MAG: TetR family transcriptional regulator [Pseudonocardiales bacterium]|nr:MAG: TetR family transcriptional regulator [Pseudonocardiales bacterium]
MLEATVAGLQRRGVAGLSFTRVLADSGAARGAIYHHFPQGKSQLVREAAQANGAQVEAALATLTGPTPTAVVERFFDAVRPVLEASANGYGCAVAAVTVETDDEDDGHRTAAHTIFTGWASRVSDALIAAGLNRDEAEDLSTYLIGLLQGAHVLCRAAGTTDPFERIVRSAQRHMP